MEYTTRRMDTEELEYLLRRSLRNESKLKEEVSAKDEEIAQLSQRVGTKDKEIDQLRKEVRELRAENAELQKDLTLKSDNVFWEWVHRG